MLVLCGCQNVIALLRAQLDEEKTSIRHAAEEIYRLEQELVSVKAEFENEKRRIVQSLEQQESEKRKQDIASIRSEFEKTIDGLKINTESLHKRIQIVRNKYDNTDDCC